MGFDGYMRGEEAPPKELKKILPFIAVIMIVFGWAHYFIFQISSRSIENNNLKNIYALVLTAGLILMPVGFFISQAKKLQLNFLIWIGYVWMGFFNFLFFFCLLEIVLSVFFTHNYSYWTIFSSLIIGTWSLRRGLQSPSLKTYRLNNKKLQGLKFVQISDLHVGMLHLNEHWLFQIVSRINQLNPDIIAITGDLVEGEYKHNTTKIDFLKNLRPETKKYYITGNHEYIHGADPWEAKLTELGFKILHNENEVIIYNNTKILIAGVPDRMIGRFFKERNSLPDLALKSETIVDYKILLAHQPASVYDLKTETCDLILSGHTHGGQIFPFHILVRMVQPVIAGFKTINGIKVFAHQGTGLWGPPMRWFSRSEIVMFEWE